MGSAAIGALLGLSPLQPPAPTAAAQTADGRRFSSADVVAVDLPNTLRALLAELGYPDGAVPMGRRVDLNSDGRPEYVVRAAPSLCGATGNCPFLLVDGASGRPIGEMFGSTFVVRDRRTDGAAVVESWAPTGADRGDHTTYVAARGVYRLASRVERTGASRSALLDSWARLPVLPLR